MPGSSPIPIDGLPTAPKDEPESGPSRQRSASGDPIEEDPSAQLKKLALAKQRHQADLDRTKYEAPQASRPRDDWQVAYVWAFMRKFHQVEKVRKLECLDDFERSLEEPVANRPDDVFEGILIRFLLNLKPGLRNLDCTNIQHHLSTYITDQLQSSPEFTVWDRPWPPNEEARGPCCSSDPERLELGRLRYIGEPIGDRMDRNPIKRMETKGGGLFELDWRERAKLLRQMVDWQLTHSETIRSVIDKEWKVGVGRGAKRVAEEVEERTAVEPIGLDRKKNRIWVFDASGRVYSSGNPFKRPCPLTSLASNRTEFLALLEQYTSHSSQTPPKLKGSGPKGKPTGAETNAHRRLLKGIEEEGKVAEALRAMVDDVEKEEQRVQRARKKIQAAQELAQQAEFRATRTRRTTRKVDYVYDNDGFDDFDEPTQKRGRRTNDLASYVDDQRPIIPGERQSARVRGSRPGRYAEDDDDDGDNDVVAEDAHGDDGRGKMDAAESSEANGRTSTPLTAEDSGAVGGGGKGKKKMKGYAWVEEFVPFERLSEKEKQDAIKAREEAGKQGGAVEKAEEAVEGKANGVEGKAKPVEGKYEPVEGKRETEQVGMGEVGSTNGHDKEEEDKMLVDG